MTVVYLDSVFLFNALLDYLLFLSTARLAGIPLRRRRYLLCGVLGGLYAAAVFLPGGGFLTETLVKAGVGLLLALIAFGRETHFLRLTLLTVAIACALAGTVLALGLLAGQHIPNARGIFYTNVNGKTLLLSASGVYLLLTVIFRAAAAHGIRGECLPVTVCLLGQTVALTALLDTGNSLRDTAGEPVLTAELSRFPQLAAAIQHRPPAETLPMLRQRFPKLRPQLLPMRTAAGGGLLVSVSSDWTEIGGVCYPNLRSGFMKICSKEALILGGVYVVLATPFSLLGFSVISDILFIVFVISGILLFFNVKFKFIDYILNKHETLSYYLCSFGWVPYFIAVMFLLLVCTHVIFGYEQELFGKSVLTLGIFAVVGFLLSPIVAFFKKKCRK